jgi:hypothetical protein
MGRKAASVLDRRSSDPRASAARKRAGQRIESCSVGGQVLGIAGQLEAIVDALAHGIRDLVEKKACAVASDDVHRFAIDEPAQGHKARSFGQATPGCKLG